MDPEHKAADELRQSCAALCAVFPNRFCYVDDTRGLSAGFHLIEGFFRDDRPLCKHVLNDAEEQELARLWDELNFGTKISEKISYAVCLLLERSERAPISAGSIRISIPSRRKIRNWSAKPA